VEKLWAVLIDADNVAADAADPLFNGFARNSVVRRMYGDFDGNHSGWREAAERHSIDRVHLSEMVPGKNGADIALVIDAVDLLHRGHVEGFCLVSSDCDFTRLARYLRENGRTVWGVGNAGQNSKFRSECSNYVDVRALIGRADTGSVKCRAAPARAIPKITVRHAGGKRNPSGAVPLIKSAMASLGDLLEPHRLEHVREALARLTPDFDPGSFAKCASLQCVIRKTGVFEIRTDAFGDEVVSRKA